VDSVTQFALGAAVGELTAGKSAGHKAILWGGIAGTIPDLDVLSSIWMDDLQSNLFHRSVSHSLLFFIVLSLPLGYLIKKIYPKNTTSTWKWTQLVFWAMFTHALLDCFTNWGTQLFWPLDLRVAFKSIFVIDPLYTIPILIGLAWILMAAPTLGKRRAINRWSILISSAYLLFTLVNKYMMERKIQEDLQEQQVSYLRMETKPAPLNNILWSVTIEQKDRYLIAYRSWLDGSDQPLIFESFDKAHELISPYESNTQIKDLKDLSQGWFSVEKVDKGLKVNDLRFGTNTGWKSGGNFVFSYIIAIEEGEIARIYEADKAFKASPGQLMQDLWNRMLGNQSR
jgi:inner membrane protein